MNDTVFKYTIIAGIFIALGVFLNYLTAKRKNATIAELMYIKNEKFLTDHELCYYQELQKIIDNEKHTIIAKVRLADLFHVKKGQKNEQIAFNKIRSKHIDFVVCNKSNLEPILLIEIDDKSHQSKKRIERDNFIDKIATDTDTKILHIKKKEEINAVAEILKLC